MQGRPGISRGSQDARHVGAHSEERNVAEVEQARVADHDVQPQPHQQEDPHGPQDEAHDLTDKDGQHEQDGKQGHPSRPHEHAAASLRHRLNVVSHLPPPAGPRYGCAKSDDEDDYSAKPGQPSELRAVQPVAHRFW